MGGPNNAKNAEGQPDYLCSYSMNCISDKLTILLYVNNQKKLQLRVPLPSIVDRGTQRLRSAHKLDAQGVVGGLFVQEPDGIFYCLNGGKDPDHDQGNQTHQCQPAHQGDIPNFPLRDKDTYWQENHQTGREHKQSQGHSDLEIQHLAAVLVHLVAAVLQPGPDQERDEDNAQSAAKM